MSKNIRNICIIAHVDHGKTTLVDHLLKQSGTFGSHEATDDRMMDSDAQERERGITISAKNASFNLGEIKVNVVDTPGHADFGGEVERIMSMVDGAILLVDAREGPLPQTRFVLDKAIRKNLPVILCVNKVDRPEVMESDLIDQTVNKVFDLFVELKASDEQCDFPIVYACARDGWCTNDVNEVPKILENPEGASLEPIFHNIVNLPAPNVEDDKPLQMLVANVSYSDYVGGLALGRVTSGSIKKNQTFLRYGVDDEGKPLKQKFTATKLFSYEGMKQVETEELLAGEIGYVAGCDKFSIGDMIGVEDSEVMERIEVEKPTMRMIFSINTTPGSGTDGKAIQSRELKERLEAEVRSNPALKLEPGEHPDQFYLHGRGELQFGVIIEKMRREGLEFMVGRPNVLYKTVDGKKQEPMERLTLDLLEEYSGDVMKLYQERKGVLALYENLNEDGEEPRIRLNFDIPTRGVLGTHSRFLTATRGTGLSSSELTGYADHVGPIAHRTNGSLIADREGSTTAYSLNTLQARGELFVGEGIKVYEGMIIGESAKDSDLNVNPIKPKKLTNVRSTGSDGLTILAPPRKMSLEKCIEWIDDDEWIEITPETIRLRKKTLPANMRHVSSKKKES